MRFVGPAAGLLLLGLVLCVIVEVAARIKNRHLSGENARLRKEIERLRLPQDQQLRQLREELRAYDTMTDRILDYLARRRSGLDLQDPDGNVLEIITAYRPGRTL